MTLVYDLMLVPSLPFLYFPQSRATAEPLQAADNELAMQAFHWLSCCLWFETSTCTMWA